MFNGAFVVAVVSLPGCGKVCALLMRQCCCCSSCCWFGGFFGGFGMVCGLFEVVVVF